MAVDRPSNGKTINNHSSDKNDYRMKQWLACTFFSNEIAPFLEEQSTGSTKSKSSPLVNADEKFKKQNQNDIPTTENFWRLLDQQLFCSQRQTQQLMLQKPANEPNPRGLGLLEMVTRGLALNQSVFEQALTVYKLAYPTVSEVTLLRGTLDGKNCNLLHLICANLAEQVEESLVSKSNWAVYNSLMNSADANQYQKLLAATDHYGHCPHDFLDAAELTVGEEKQLFYALPSNGIDNN